MWKVDIYLETDSTFQAKRQRKCGYVLATTVHGEEKTKESFGISNGTYHQTTLQTLIHEYNRIMGTGMESAPKSGPKDPGIPGNNCPPGH